MREVQEAALNQAQLSGATYADVRVVSTKDQSVSVKNGEIEALTSREDIGFGVRVLFGGAWGFACSNDLTSEQASDAAKMAVEIARASASANGQAVSLAPVSAVTADYRSPYVVDPFTVPLNDKIDLLLSAERALREDRKIAIAGARVSCRRRQTNFASSEGSRINQDIVESGVGMSATAIDGSVVERRSYPNSMGGQCATRGWELVEEVDLLANAPRVRDEAVALLTAPACPSAVTTVIIDSSQLALQIHESIGHATELDRILGMEASFAGTSFVTLDMLGSYRYGSNLVNITADATIPGGLGSFAFDDEGVPAQRVDIIKNGILQSVLSSRETAPRIKQASNGTSRADGWNRIPIIRMTNINLLPGESTLDNLISSTENGVFLSTNKSWSIDDKRLNFQFATEIAWEIKRGKLGRIFRSPNYTGITPTFWNSCDAVCDQNHWTVWGTPNCGKGEPMQIAHVAHGAAPARFNNIQIGVGR